MSDATTARPTSPVPDWTRLPGGQLMSESPEYIDVARFVESLIRTNAQRLINGEADVVARIIVSRLAAEKHMAPICSALAQG